MAKRISTNHLDKLMGTSGQFPGVQLKRTDREDRTLYQVETKVKRMIPARNIGFGTYDALEKAQRAYNLGTYIMGATIQELFYPFPDNHEIANICPDSSRERLHQAVLNKDFDGILDMRKLIKKYLDDCKCSEDSEAFKKRVFDYLQGTQKQLKVRQPGARRRTKGLDGQASEPAPSPSVDAGEHHGDSVVLSQQTNKGVGQSNQTHNAIDPIPNAAPLPAPKRKRAYTKRVVEGAATNTNDTDYAELPAHFYGIIAHGGNLGTHEYPPQLNCNGTFVCPCFFNHNFSVRSEHAESVGLQVEWSNTEVNCFKKYHNIDSKCLKLCIKRVGYNYEAGECVQGYYKGPLPLRYIGPDDKVYDIQPNYSIYNYESGHEQQNQQQTDSMQIDGLGTLQSQQQNAKLFLDEDNNPYVYDPSMNNYQLIEKDDNDHFWIRDPLTQQYQQVAWDDDGNIYVFDPAANDFLLKIC